MSRTEKRIRAVYPDSTLAGITTAVTQHVHYLIDVLCAPPVAYAAFRLTRAVRMQLGMADNDSGPGLP
jgi:hypothetical protein